MGIDELSNILKYVIAYMDFCFKIDTLALIIDAIFLYCLVYFFLLSTHSLKEPYMVREPMVSEQTVAYQSVYGQNARNYSNASDWHM